MAASSRPGLGRNGPSLTREATLGVSSALLGFLCQGRKFAKLWWAIPAPPGKVEGLYYASIERKRAIQPLSGG